MRPSYFSRVGYASRATWLPPASGLPPYHKRPGLLLGMRVMCGLSGVGGMSRNRQGSASSTKQTRTFPGETDEQRVSTLAIIDCFRNPCWCLCNAGRRLEGFFIRALTAHGVLWPAEASVGMNSVSTANRPKGSGALGDLREALLTTLRRAPPAGTRYS